MYYNFSEEYLRIVQSTEFNGQSLLYGEIDELRIQAGYGVPYYRLIDPCKVCISVKVVFTFLIGTEFNYPFINQEKFIDPVSTPDAVIIGLQPVDAYNGILVK